MVVGTSTRSALFTPTTTTRTVRVRSPRGPHVDVLNLKDPVGARPGAGSPLVPVLRAASPNLSLEVHSRMAATIGGACYAEAVDWVLGTSARQRDRSRTVRRSLRRTTIATPAEQGFRVDLDALHEVSRYRRALQPEPIWPSALSVSTTSPSTSASFSAGSPRLSPGGSRRSASRASLARHPRRAPPRSRRARLSDDRHAAGQPDQRAGSLNITTEPAGRGSRTSGLPRGAGGYRRPAGQIGPGLDGTRCSPRRRPKSSPPKSTE